MCKSTLRRTIGAILIGAAAVTSALPATTLAQDEVAPPPAPGPVEGPTPMEEVVVTARQRSAATDIIQERIEQPVVVDLVSAEQISRVGDSSVSLALRRLPGVSLVGDQFIYIRGLGERYSSTTLNGANVPSPDLTRNVIPLDIFPAEIIDSLSIQKGYTADRPAAFGGGNVDIRTRAIPESALLQFQAGTGWNSDSGDDVLTYAGGSDDALGTDDGTRALPRAIHDGIQEFQGNFTPVNILEALERDGQPHTLAEAEAVNRTLATSLNRNVDFRSESADPDYSLEGAAGNKWDLDADGDWRFGLLGVADYKNQWRNRERINRSVQSPDLDHGETFRSINQVSLTGSLGAGLEFTRDHEVEVLGLFLRNTEDEAALTQRNNFNFRREQGQQLRDYRIRFEERELELLQLHGRHTLGDDTAELLGSWADSIGLLKELTYSWFYSDATATTDVPSEITISAVDRVDPDSGAVQQTAIRSTTSAADYRFTELEDQVNSYGWELAKPFRLGDFAGEISGGWQYYEKGRSYVQTQLGLGTTSLAASPILVGTPGQVLTDENITDPDNGFLLSLGGIGTESYLAAETVDAYFGTADVTWRDAWRLTAGVRWEDFKQLALPVNTLNFDVDVPTVPLTPDEIEEAVTSEDDYYPSVALTHMRSDFWADDFQLRFGWSKTTARPDLREVSDAFFIDPLTEARVRGNPDLIASDLTNYDIRAEWFFANRDNLTLSLFYKEIDNPIETLEGAGTDNNISFTFANADEAEVYGTELEWFKDLSFIGNWLGGWVDGFFTAGNVTLSDSEITIGESALQVTNNVRPLTQQSDVILNIQLGYDSPGGHHGATLVYNSYSERLLFGGRNGAPDAYEQPFNSLDLVYTWYPSESWNVRLRLQNLLDDNLEVEQGGVVVLEQDIGLTSKLDLTFRF